MDAFRLEGERVRCVSKTVLHTPACPSVPGAVFPVDAMKLPYLIVVTLAAMDAKDDVDVTITRSLELVLHKKMTVKPARIVLWSDPLDLWGRDIW